MTRGIAIILLVSTFFCVTLFLGCASVPKEQLDEKEAIIQNLNNQIDTLKQEVNRLTTANEELMNIKANLEMRLKEKTQQQKLEEKPELKIK